MTLQKRKKGQKEFTVLIKWDRLSVSGKGKPSALTAAGASWLLIPLISAHFVRAVSVLVFDLSRAKAHVCSFFCVRARARVPAAHIHANVSEIWDYE